MVALTTERAASQELRALEALKASIAEAAKDDPDLLLDMAEGETNILEIFDRLLEADMVDASLLAGLETAEEIVAFRKARFSARIKTRRALIEQGLMLLERDKLERPTATVTLAKRKPTVKVLDESALPARFFKTKPVLDKKALDEAVAGGEVVPGAELTNGSVSLTVRRK